MEYDFYEGDEDIYVFRGTAALTFRRPLSADTMVPGTGVMNVGYCFVPNGDAPRPMVAVQTGFVRDGIIPIKIARYRGDKGESPAVADIIDTYSFSGEYNCASETLKVGFTGLFDGNAFTADNSVKNDALDEFNEFGCLIESSSSGDSYYLDEED